MNHFTTETFGYHKFIEIKNLSGDQIERLIGFSKSEIQEKLPITPKVLDILAIPVYEEDSIFEEIQDIKSKVNFQDKYVLQRSLKGELEIVFLRKVFEEDMNIEEYFELKKAFLK